MSALVHGHLSVSRRNQEQELSRLLRLIGLPGVRAPELLRDYCQVHGSFRGVSCKVVCMENPDLMRSVSIVLPLASPTTLRLKLQNTESVRLGLAITQVGVDADKQRETVDPRLLRPDEMAELMQLGVPFVLTLLEDQLTMTVYGIYQAGFYESLMELLCRIRGRTADLSS
ncbi:MAG: hypothetical protein Q8P31_04685 [Bacillota bacterium]|nr:hypothetical protein [Bacillota bacterium]